MLGAVIGNISLGFMLGMSSIVNSILGIPFDVRHITISAGNVSVALYGLGIKNCPRHTGLLFFWACWPSDY